jgi:hypothetical protein
MYVPYDRQVGASPSALKLPCEHGRYVEAREMGVQDRRPIVVSEKLHNLASYAQARIERYEMNVDAIGNEPIDPIVTGGPFAQYGVYGPSALCRRPENRTQHADKRAGMRAVI